GLGSARRRARFLLGALEPPLLPTAHRRRALFGAPEKQRCPGRARAPADRRPTGTKAVPPRRDALLGCPLAANRPRAPRRACLPLPRFRRPRKPGRPPTRGAIPRRDWPVAAARLTRSAGEGLGSIPQRPTGAPARERAF